MNHKIIPIILIVDDSTIILHTLYELLRPKYRVLAATSGEDGLLVANQIPPPDLIILDVMMPSLNGYETLIRLQNNSATQNIPVIFLTGLADTENEEHGLQLGAIDFITKPFAPSVVLARVRTHLEAKQARDWIKNKNALLEAEVTRRMTENNLTQRVSIRALAHLAELRDPETGNHILRTQSYVQRLANGLKQHPRFTETLTNQYIELLTLSAPLHDIGKVGIPDHILFKPCALTPDEWIIMKTHAQLGSEAIELAERDIDEPLMFLSIAKEIAHWHHEKWDGSGYPDGLVGNEIPVSSRLMAVADVFDALISKRIYKSEMTINEARDIIISGRGKHFDPDVVDVFLDGLNDFVAIAERYRHAT